MKIIIEHNIEKTNDIQEIANYSISSTALEYETKKGINEEKLTYLENIQNLYNVVEWLIQNEKINLDYYKDKLDWVKLFTNNKDYIECGENLVSEIKEHIQRKTSGLQYEEACKIRVQEAVKREYYKWHKQYFQQLQSAQKLEERIENMTACINVNP